MKVSNSVHCATLPCADVEHGGFWVPDVDVDPASVSIVLISEVAAPATADNYRLDGESLFARTTVEAFRAAGAAVEGLDDVFALGVHLTTAVKCSKLGYGVKAGTIATCSVLLERELDLFPNARVYLLMGDVAISAINAIARRAGEPRPVPAGSTYRIRGGTYTFRGRRVLPSYLQAGPSFFIEKGKQRVIAEDIRTALQLVA